MIDRQFCERLRCPVDRTRVAPAGDVLRCEHGHDYPVVDDVPVMLIPDIRQTMTLAGLSLQRASGTLVDARAPQLHLESLGISEDEKNGVLALAGRGSAIDPVVAYLVAATNGLMYRHLIGQLERYPLPDLPLPDGNGRSFLDVGCSWGRWSIAAAQRGYAAIGIDPSLGAVMAARRVARQLGATAQFVVGDARHLPFADAAFDCVYSYSVIQHFSRDDAAAAVGEMGRVAVPGGVVKVQMPTRFGVRCLMHQARRGFRDGDGFEVRYWSLPELRRLFGDRVGATRISVDCFFGIGLQPSDAPLMTRPLTRVLAASEFLKGLSRHWRPLTWIADSVFVEATRGEAA